MTKAPENRIVQNSALSTPSSWDHSSHHEFFRYYVAASSSEEARQRFTSIRETVLRVLADQPSPPAVLNVADIGCGAGTQCMIWAELGHSVHGLDVNQPLLALARERASAAGFTIDFRVGSATELPWADASMNVCLVLELLEHVQEWEVCLAECIRVLKPGGILFLTTSNKLCPAQQEFNLPLYSWYPGPLKRRFEQWARTTKPQLANFAKYPAVNWFSFYGLRSFLAKFNFTCADRFDLIDTQRKDNLVGLAVTCIRKVPLLRLLGHMSTSGTIILAIKAGAARTL